MTRRTILLAATATALVTQILPAKADAIDGDWCSADRQRISINGPAIVTPAGAHTQGNYSRHFFSYVLPAGEPGAGVTVSITLLGENLAQARTGENGPLQEWKRCQPGIS